MPFGCSIAGWPRKWANCVCYQCKFTFVYLGSLTTWCSVAAVCGSSMALHVLSACFASIWRNLEAHCLNVSFFHSIFSYLVALNLMSENLWMNSRQHLFSVFTSCESVALPPCHTFPKNNLHCNQHITTCHDSGRQREINVWCSCTESTTLTLPFPLRRVMTVINRLIWWLALMFH